MPTTITDPTYRYFIQREPVAAGERVWRATEVRHLPPEENRGRRNIYVDAFDLHGQPARSLSVGWTWAGRNSNEQAPPVPLDKPAGEPMANIPIFAGQHISVWIEDPGTPSDLVGNLHGGHPDELGPSGELWNSYGHHSFHVTFQQMIETGGDNGDPEPAPDPIEPTPTEPDGDDEHTIYAPYIFGLHELGGEQLMLNAGKPGWVLCLADIGLDGRHGVDYTPLADKGLGIVVRLNHGYGRTGTIPRPGGYRDFARACATYALNSPGCRWWIIGNEPNHEQERPGGELILPADYAACYQLCRNAIRSLPDHEDDLVLVAGPAPWNTQTAYPGNEKGDWLQYWRDCLRYLTNCDGFAIHTYTHTPDPALITGDYYHSTPGYTHLRNEFRTYRDWMGAIPQRFRHLPVLITETNPVDGWPDVITGWVRAAYDEIAAWNADKSNQPIQALILYRWPNLPDQPQWAISAHTAVIDEFRDILHSASHNYRVRAPKDHAEATPSAPTPEPDGARLGVVNAPAGVNLRAQAGLGSSILTALPQGVTVSIVGQVRADSMVWYAVNVGQRSGYVAATYVSVQEESPYAPDRLLRAGTGFAQMRIASLYNRFGRLLEVEAGKLKIDVSTAIAVLMAESGGDGYGPDGRVKIRFENHVFEREFVKDDPGRAIVYRAHFDHDAARPWEGHLWRPQEGPWRPCHVDQRQEWEVLEFAATLDPLAAYSSISMGMAQIMGFHYGALGYTSPRAMLAAFQEDVAAQIRALYQFIAAKGLAKALQEGDLVAFAAGFNGPGQAAYYATLIEHYRREFGGLRP